MGNSQGRNEVQVPSSSAFCPDDHPQPHTQRGFSLKADGARQWGVLGVPDIVRPQRCLEESSGTLSPGPPSHWIRTDIAEEPVCVPVFAGEGKWFAEGRELGRGVMSQHSPCHGSWY